METPFGAVNWTDVAIISGGVIAICLVVLYLAILTQGDRASGHQLGANLARERAVVAEWSGTEGMVRIGGELWHAASTEPLVPGDKVKVVRADGLMLEVRKA
ncbi:MAG: NfeD family protein [Parvularculaceae bacterium]